jgi:DNA invertase Pin-like site-specific DNA recombinase
MRIGYVRNQDVELMEQQLNMILERGVDEVILDRTGDRLPELLERLRSGDVLNIATLDRLSRDIQKASRILEDLCLRGVELYVGGNRFELSETMSPEGKIAKAIRAGLIDRYGEKFLELDPKFQYEMIRDAFSDFLR